jgi:hypothetical protein
MGAASRRKGAAGEREWCAFLKRHGYHDAERNITQTRAGGGDVPVPPQMYEVKRYAKIRVREFLDQAIASLPKHPGCEMPIVAMREDGRTDWMVLLRAEDLMKLLNNRPLGWNLPKGML